MNELSTAVIVIATTPVWLAWTKALARFLFGLLLPVAGFIAGVFCILVWGSLLDSFFSVPRGTGAASTVLAIPVLLVGWIVVAVLRSAWGEVRLGWS